MRIAVELNNIVRDCNTQALKYYIKEYDPRFDDTDIDLDCTDLLEKLPFKGKAQRKTFKEIDYPYELFGCARTMSMHLHVNVSDWLEYNPEIELLYFTTNESDLMTQSTYFFLSKGSRTKTMKFLDNPEDIWQDCDVAVTINKDVVNSKPDNKKVVVIERSDNGKLQKKADLVYPDLEALIADKNFKEKLTVNHKTIPFLTKLKYKIKDLWRK